MSVSGWTNTTSGYDNNDYGTTLTNGVYNNGAGLTSVGSLSGVWSASTKHDVYGIDNADLSSGSNNQNIVYYPYVSLFWEVIANNVASTELYSKDNANKKLSINT